MGKIFDLYQYMQRLDQKHARGDISDSEYEERKQFCYDKYDQLTRPASFEYEPELD